MNKSLILIISVVLLLGLGLWFLLTGDSNDRALSIIEPRPTVEGGIKIIAFGDSLTAGYGLPASESYPAQLEEALQQAGYSVEVINSGVSGETTRGNLERADFIRKQNPDVVLLGIGGNDALRLLPLEETRKNIKSTIETLKTGEKPPVIILLKMQAPLNAGLGYKREFDAVYEEVAEATGVLLVPFLTAEVFLDAENKLTDGIHLNKVGYSKVIDLYILPVLTEVLDRMKED